MSAPEIVAIVVGIINFLALVVVIWQTYLTRKSIQIGQDNLLEAQKASLISNLPRAYSIIHVQNCLEGWKKDLELLTDNEKKLRDMIDSNRTDIQFEPQYWFGQAKGLIDKNSYAFLPEWLKEIHVVGAQYYYEAMCLVDYIRDSSKEKDKRIDLVKEVVSRAEEGVFRITEILKFIDLLIPRWYLESPASLQESDFVG